MIGRREFLIMSSFIAGIPLRIMAAGDKPILVLGDSLAVGLATGLTQIHKTMRIDGHGKISSGLAKPSFFDWPGEAAHLARIPNKGVFMLLGLNDLQPLNDDGHYCAYGSSDWNYAYGRRVAKIIKTFDTPFVWVGLPRMRDSDKNKGAEKLNEIFAEVVPKNGGLFVSTWEATGRDGAFALYLKDSQGREVLARQTDGEHFTAQGYQMLAQTVIHSVCLNAKFAAMLD